MPESVTRPLRGFGLFLLVSLPVWLASHFLWAYDGGLNLWPWKNAAELLSIAVVSLLYTIWVAGRWRARVPPLGYLAVALAAFAFLLGGFKAANDYLDPPDLLLGLAAQGISFLYLVREAARVRGPERPGVPGRTDLGSRAPGPGEP